MTEKQKAAAAEAERKVLDGSAWAEFCDALKDAGSVVHSAAAPDDAFNRAEGYRYLTRLLRGGLESCLDRPFLDSF